MRSKRSDRSAKVLPNRLKDQSNVWRRFVASQEVLGIVCGGHKLRFDTPPCLVTPKPGLETKQPPQQMAVLRHEVKQLLTKGAIRKVSLNEALTHPGFYSKIFVVPKPGVNKWRTIIDCGD